MTNNSKPIVYLLCGLPGTGKTTFAKNNENDMIICFSLDQELFKKYGRNFDPSSYKQNEEETKESILEKVKVLLGERKSVILDWGFWKKEERDRIKKFILNNNGIPKLIYFKNKSKIEGRNLDNNHLITEDMMENFKKQFEEPNNEEEILYEYQRI